MSTIETRIAEVLDDAIGFDCTHQDFDNPLHADAPGKCHHCYQQALKLAAALAPVIAEVRAEALRGAAAATQSWIESPLMCLSKCSDPECRDCIRIDALNEYATWLRARDDKLDTL